MTGFANTNVALLYVSAGTELNANGERKPRRRAKSTVVGLEITCGELFWPFRVMELRVSRKLTTENKGPSSPVTNTLAGCVPDEMEFEELAPQPTSTTVASRAAALNAKIFFMASSRERDRK